MIGLDTNILVRYFARDDPILTPVADALLDSLSEGTRGFVPTVVLVELIWTMDKRYGADASELIEIVEYLTRRRIRCCRSVGLATVRINIHRFR